MVLYLINLLFTVYFGLIIARIVGSWIPELMQFRVMHFVCFYVDPYLNLFRRIIPPLGMIDISPIVAIFALSFLKAIIVSVVRSF